MKTIWKFQLKVDDFQTLEIPKDSKLLAVQTQGETPCLWALVSPENQRESIEIMTIGTGHPVEKDFKGKYLGTYQLFGGVLIFHVFLV